MLEWPRPWTLIELRGFLGLTRYYRKFVLGYEQTAGPLTKQLKKDCYRWNEEVEQAFHQLKEVMTQVPVLAMPDFSKPFVIEANAFGFVVGAVLMQEGKPMAYHSQVLGQRTRQKSTYEKELMAIVMAVLKWRPYLLGRHFIIQTDQWSLKFLLEQRMIGTKY